MSRRTSVLLLVSWLAAPGVALAQDGELTPEKLAAIRRDEKAAQDKVNAAYGNRKPSEMSNEERRQVIQDQQKAGQDVMTKHGVSDKEYSRQVARMGREERAAVDQAEQKLEAEEKAKAAAEQKKAEQDQKPSEDIPIQQGISDENPVELESSQDAASVVEEGLPPGETGLDETPAEGSAEGVSQGAAPRGDVPEGAVEIPVQ
jgi:hypothetical protein